MLRAGQSEWTKKFKKFKNKKGMSFLHGMYIQAQGLKQQQKEIEENFNYIIFLKNVAKNIC